MLKFVLTVTFISFGIDSATAQSATSFDDCLSQISSLATEIGAPVNIVETSTMRLVRFPTVDGSVLITCATVAPFMAVTKSDQKCGVDVSC